jgi:hypothetical protein
LNISYKIPPSLFKINHFIEKKILAWSLLLRPGNTVRQGLSLLSSKSIQFSGRKKDCMIQADSNDLETQIGESRIAS